MTGVLSLPNTLDTLPSMKARYPRLNETWEAIPSHHNYHYLTTNTYTTPHHTHALLICNTLGTATLQLHDPPADITPLTLGAGKARGTGAPGCPPVPQVMTGAPTMFPFPELREKKYS